MNPLISIVVPVYNAEKYLSNCVDSLISQTHDNIEIILVNDGSKDSSPQIIAEFCQKNKNVVAVHQENRGVSAARNAGINAAKGDYIMFVDADDTITDDAVCTMLQKAKETDADMVIGKMKDDEDLPVGIFSGEDFLKMCLEDISACYYAWRILYKRSLLEGIFFSVGRVCSEDSFFVFECALRKPTVATIDKKVYNYTANPTSVTNSGFTAKKHDDICYFLNEKEAIISKEYKHLLPVFYHLKVKIQMQLLTNMMNSNDKSFKDREIAALRELKKLKKYFRSDMPHSKRLYFIFSHNLYFPFKFIYRLLNRR